SPGSSICTSGSGSRCATRSSSPTPVPPTSHRNQETAMSLATPSSNDPPGPTMTAEADPEHVLDPDARRSVRRRRLAVRAIQVGLFVVIFGGWELFVRLNIVDSFFFGSPSGIVAQLGRWSTSGTVAGPLWTQVGVTLEEAVLGFVLGVVLGVVCGVALGRV